MNGLVVANDIPVKLCYRITNNCGYPGVMLLALKVRGDEKTNLILDISDLDVVSNFNC